MYKIYVIKHKTINCAYIRICRPNTKFSTQSVVFTPLRNCLTQHLTSKSTEERKIIYEWLELNGLLIDSSKNRATGWTESWDYEILHDDLKTEEETLLLFNRVYHKLEKEGFFILNSRFMR